MTAFILNQILQELENGKQKVINILSSIPEWSEEWIDRFAKAQLGIAVIWPSALSVAAGNSTIPSLIKAFAQNALSEVGTETHAGHAYLARKFALSLGLTDLDVWTSNPYNQLATSRLFAGVDAKNEGYTVGYILGNEGLAGTMFAELLPFFKTIPSCEIEYLEVHALVDPEVHEQELIQGLTDLLTIYPEAIEGVKKGLCDIILSRFKYLDYIKTGVC